MTNHTTSLPLSFNGEPIDALDASTLHELLQRRGHDVQARAFACAVNGRFVPRVQWSQCALQAGDRIDIVAPVTGG